MSTIIYVFLRNKKDINAKKKTTKNKKQKAPYLEL